MRRLNDVNTKSRLVDAIRRGHVRPAFQCLVDLRSNGISGFEVLARWTDPVAGNVHPSEFIPTAETNGVIDALTVTIIRQACAEAVLWEGSFFLAFNLSPIQFQNRSLFDLVTNAVRSVNFPLTRVQIEITESALISDRAVGTAILRDFKAAGIKIALDDFGTGFSSLTRLHAFPFDKIKIDASFVKAMESDSDSRKIVAAVVGLGKNLGIDVVAEGVETSTQASILRTLGCDLAQGWLYGKAVCAQEAKVMLERCVGEPSLTDALTNISPFQRIHQLQALYRHAPIALCFLDCRMRYVSANDRFAEIYGCSVDEIIGQNASDLLHRDRTDQVVTAVRRILNGECLPAIEIQSSEREEFHLAFAQRVDDDAGDPVGVSVIILDITDRKRTEMALRASADHFRRSVELSPDIAWAASPDGTVDYMGPTFDEMGDDSVPERIAAWQARMHPDDQVRVRSSWLAWIPSGLPFETEFRIKWPDGSWRWMHSRARPHHTCEGTIDRWYGIIADVTDRKILQRRVVELEEQLKL